MNAVEVGIYAKLSGDATLMATATGVYHRKAPAGSVAPYVVFHKQSGIHDFALASRMWRDYLYLIKIVDQSDSTSQAGTLLERIDTLLNDGTITVSGYSLMEMRRQSDVEYDEVVEGVTWQHVGALFRIWIQ